MQHHQRERKTALAALTIGFLAVVGAPQLADAQTWSEWVYVVNDDPINDRTTYSVAAQESRFSPAYVYLACNNQRSWLAFSDGTYIAQRTTIPGVAVRFDQQEPIDLPFSDISRNPAFLVHWESSVAFFASGLREASTIAFRIDGGRTHVVDLTGASEAIAQLEANCTLPHSEAED